MSLGEGKNRNVQGPGENKSGLIVQQSNSMSPGGQKEEEKRHVLEDQAKPKPSFITQQSNVVVCVHEKKGRYI